MTACHRFTDLRQGPSGRHRQRAADHLLRDARDVYEEGALIFPAVKVQRDYRDIDDVIRMCRARIRVPEQWYGDYLALIGAARIGERELLALGREVGWDALAEHAAAWFDYSEGAWRQRSPPAGGRGHAGRASTTRSRDPAEGLPITVTVRTDPQRGRSRSTCATTRTRCPTA